MNFKRFWLAILIVLSIVSTSYSATISSGGGHQIQDEGNSLTQRPKLNFTGTKVGCTDNSGNNSTDCNVVDEYVPPTDLYVKGHTYLGELTNMDYGSTPIDGSGWNTQTSYPFGYNHPGELLLHADDASCSGTAFANSGTGNHTMTAVGNTTHSSARSKFGGCSAYFDGSGDWLTTPDSADFDFSGGIWTIDMWINITSFTASRGLWAQGTDANNYIHSYVEATTGKITLIIQSGGVQVLTVQTGGVFINQWYHIEYVENGNNYYIFINGALTALTTSTVRPANYTGVFYIGSTYGGANSFPGYIDEIRTMKGVVGNTLDFNSPDAAYPNTAYSNTACELGSKCVNFDGFDDYIKIYGFDILPSGSSARTIEGWIFPTSSTKRGVIFSYGTDTDNNLISLEMNGWQSAENGKLVFRTRNNAVKSTTSLTLNQWNWVAVTLNGTGTSIAGTDATLNTSDDGVRLYVNSSTAETLVAVTGMGNTATINTIVEQAYIGRGQHRCKSGFGGCIKFDGTNDYVNTVDNANLRPATYLSLSAWVYVNSEAAGQSIIGYGNNSNYRLHITTAGAVYFYMNNASVACVSSQNAVPLNEWTLINATAVNGDYRIYLNGNLIGRCTSGTFGYGNSGVALRIGDAGNGTAYFNGSIDDVRVYNTRLSLEDIWRIYRHGYGQPCTGTETGLVSCWSFNDGTGTTAVSTNSAYNGTLTNFSSTTQDFDTDGWQTNGEFSGAMDEIAIWNVALTGSTTPTLAQRYNTGSGAELAGTETGLLLNYHFNYSDTLSASAIQSATVSGVGSDSNNCISTSTPCLTVTQALTKITNKYFAGPVTVHLASGIIPDSITMQSYHPSGNYSLVIDGYINATPNQFSNSAYASGTSTGSNTANFPDDTRSIFNISSADKDMTFGFLELTGGTGFCSGSGYNPDNWYPIEVYWAATSLSIVGTWNCGIPDNTTTYNIYRNKDMATLYGSGRPIKYNGDINGTNFNSNGIGKTYGIQIADSSGIILQKTKFLNFDKYGVQFIDSYIPRYTNLMVEYTNFRGISAEQNTVVGTSLTKGVQGNIVKNTFAGIRAEKQSSLTGVYNNITFNQINCGFCNFFSSINEYVYQNLWKNSRYACFDGEHVFNLYTYGYNRSDSCGTGGGIETATNAAIRIDTASVVTNSQIGILMAYNGSFAVPSSLTLSYNDLAIQAFDDSFVTNGSANITLTGNTANIQDSGKLFNAATSSVTGFLPGTGQMYMYLKNTGSACELRGLLYDSTDTLITTIKAAACP